MHYGHFDLDHDEYVIDRPDVPASWINYLGVKDWCTVINQNAGGYSFYRSSQQGRVTRFRPNGVPLDRPGHYVYVRDDEDGDYWSVSWQPVGKPLDQAHCRARHGLSYSVFECAYRDIEASQRVFVPRDDDVELWDVTLTNRSDRVRRLSLFGYVEFSFHTVTIDNENFQMSLYASGADYADGIVEYDFYYEPWTYHYFTSTLAPTGFDTLRDDFLGAYRTETNPLAVERGACTGSQQTTGNHCGALQHAVTLHPGETIRYAYLLGYGRRAAGAMMREKYADPGAVDAALADLRTLWADKKARLSVDTPSAAMNTLLNTWTLYQAETCVTWSRFASFVEVGGRVGLGYRDTAQDVASVIHSNPARTRQRMEELIHGQMSQGYGLHLFDPLLLSGAERPDIPVGVKLPTVVPGRASDLVHGIADACSDDHLWLVPSVCDYVKETGDFGFLAQVIPFADSDMGAQDRAQVLGAETAARFDPAPVTVYEHLLRAIEFTAEQVGEHGVAKGLRADWNDCLNLGGGETALVTFLEVWAARALRDAAAAWLRSDESTTGSTDRADLASAERRESSTESGTGESLVSTGSTGDSSWTPAELPLTPAEPFDRLRTAPVEAKSPARRTTMAEHPRVTVPAPGRDLAADIARLDAIIAQTTAVANRELWDGAWYIRGYTRDGAKIGSDEAPEGKVFLEHMPWAVIAGVADRTRGEQAMAAVKTHLASPYGIHLCQPSYTHVDDTIGYITRVYPGVKENGSIFSHPNAWPVIAEAMLGHGDQAAAYYEAMAPCRYNEAIETRGAEPYVYCQFLYGRDHPWYGKAQNPWLTGTAGWMYTAATKHILGIRPDYDALIVDPCIPAAWDGYTVQRLWRGTTYEIDVVNPAHVSAGVAMVAVDGRELIPVYDPLADRWIARIAPSTGRRVHVAVTLG